MGYSDSTFDFVLNHKEEGFLSKGSKIMELGAQEINTDVSVLKIIDFVKTFNPAYSDFKDLIQRLPGGFVSKVYEAAGLSYRAYDLFAAPNTEIIDLNTASVCEKDKNKYDYITNFGTTEHIFNQANVFSIIHAILKVGGIAVHAVPFMGYFNHGLIKYEPRFFLYLSHVNEYEVIDWSLNGQEKFHVMPKLDDKRNVWSEEKIPGGIITFIIRKRNEHAFKMPTDVDLRILKKSYPDKICKGMQQSVLVHSE